MTAIRPKLAALLFLPLGVVLGGLFLSSLGLGFLQSLGLLSLVELGAPTMRFYADLFSSPDIIRSLALTAYVGASATLLSAGLGLLVALLLRHMARGAGLAGTIVQLPLPIPHLVAAIGMGLLLAQSGLLARLLYAVDLIDLPAEMPALTADRHALGIIMTYVWKETPFLALVTLAALRTSGDEVEHAARTLGASPWQTLRHITLPLIAPALLRAALVVFAFTIGAFEVPLLLGQSYPRMLGVEAFQRYHDTNLALRPSALALSTLTTLCTLLAVLPLLWLARRSALALPDQARRQDGG